MVPARRQVPGRSSQPSTEKGVTSPVALPRPKIVLLGMLTRIPFAGVAWLVGQYAAGFERLGYDVYYVEAHARTPFEFMKDANDGGTEGAAHYISEVARRFGLGDRWAFQALHEDGRCLGMSAEQLDRLYRDAALIINLHGGTLPLPEHAATDRLIYLGTDPVATELKVHYGEREAVEFLDQHAAFFTWGLNFGNPDCTLPWADPYSFVPSPPPVILDFWENDSVPGDDAPFSTIGNWRQTKRPVEFEGRVYRWSKHAEFLKILELPRRTQARIELALSSYNGHDRLLLAEHGWGVRPGLEISSDLDTYRDYIVESAGEISAAKEQNIRFRTGWFSERSATYLAAGRPVILQDTGFGAALPTGEGLFAFTNLGEAAEAMRAVQTDPARHRRAAREVAREYLSHEVVLGDMLDHIGLRPRAGRRTPSTSPAPVELPEKLSLKVSQHRPLQLDEETSRYVLSRPIPAACSPAAPPVVTVVVLVLDNLACTRLSLESILANTDELPYEVVVVDKGSAESTRKYLEALAARNRHLHLIRDERNRGFAGACNRGLAAAKGETLVVLQDDVIVPPRWLPDLAAHLEEPAIGIVVPATNRSVGGAQQVPTSYTTYGEMLQFARKRREELAGSPARDIDVADMFCVALRRGVFDAVGPFDERLEGVSFQDDYARRVRDAGHEVACAYDTFAHRFGGTPPASLDDRPDSADAALARRVEAAVRHHVPAGSTVLVVSREDEALVGLDGREVWTFPSSTTALAPITIRPGTRGDLRTRAAARARRRLPGAACDVALVARPLRGLSGSSGALPARERGPRERGHLRAFRANRSPGPGGDGRRDSRHADAISTDPPRAPSLSRRPRAYPCLPAADAARGLDAAGDPRPTGARLPDGLCRAARRQRSRRHARQPGLPPTLPRERARQYRAAL